MDGILPWSKYVNIIMDAFCRPLALPSFNGCFIDICPKHINAVCMHASMSAKHPYGLTASVNKISSEGHTRMHIKQATERKRRRAIIVIATLPSYQLSINDNLARPLTHSTVLYQWFALTTI